MALLPVLEQGLLCDAILQCDSYVRGGPKEGEVNLVSSTKKYNDKVRESGFLAEGFVAVESRSSTVVVQFSHERKSIILMLGVLLGSFLVVAENGVYFRENFFPFFCWIREMGNCSSST